MQASADVTAAVKKAEGAALEIVKKRGGNHAVALWGAPPITLLENKHALRKLSPAQQKIVSSRGSWLAFPGGTTPECAPKCWRTAAR